jgi:hypothetical protein
MPTSAPAKAGHQGNNGRKSAPIGIVFGGFFAIRNKPDDKRGFLTRTMVDRDTYAFKKDRFSLLTTEELQVSPALLSELKAVAQVRLAVTALAVERCRSAHGGRVPELISEITPNFLSAIPSDPFDGRPLRFKQLEKGYVIYSIGEDLTDDGGKTKTANAADSNHYDITFSVER